MLSYNMSFVKPTPGEYSVSAVLNMGWCSRSGDDWMHGGDYLTTTTFNVEVTAQKNLYEADIELEHYQSKFDLISLSRIIFPFFSSSIRTIVI